MKLSIRVFRDIPITLTQTILMDRKNWKVEVRATIPTQCIVSIKFSDPSIYLRN